MFGEAFYFSKDNEVPLFWDQENYVYSIFLSGLK